MIKTEIKIQHIELCMCKQVIINAPLQELSVEHMTVHRDEQTGQCI